MTEYKRFKKVFKIYDNIFVGEQSSLYVLYNKERIMILFKVIK